MSGDHWRGSFDAWKTRVPLDDEEPEAEPGCVCAGEDHGVDCPEFEPPTAESLLTPVVL